MKQLSTTTGSRIAEFAYKKFPLWVLFMSACPALSAVQFGSPVTYPAGDHPYYVAVGDFNGDGIPDLAVANSFGNSVSIFRGVGDGTFVNVGSYGVGVFPEAILVGDFNGDGHLDIVTLNINDNSMSVLLGRGDGIFSKTNYSLTVGLGRIVAVAGDFDRDGNLDIVAGSSHGWGGNLLFFRGRGDGTFADPLVFDLASPAINAITAADLDQDGKLDVITAGWDGYYENVVSELRGNGDGTFQDAARYQVCTNSWTSPISVAVGDLDGDGKPDILTINGSPPCYSVLLGNGDGSLGAPQVHYVTNWLGFVSIADVDGDGKLDFLTADADGMVSVLSGNGDGTFGLPASISSGQSPYSSVLADLNRDGKLDVIMGSVNGVTIMLNQTPSAPPTLKLNCAGQQVTLSWHAFGNTAFLLECTTNLLSPGVWMPVTNSPIAIGGQIVVTNEAGAGPCFYRLHQKPR